MTAVRIASLVISGLCLVLDVLITSKAFKYVKETGYGRGTFIFDAVITLGAFGLFAYNIARVIML